MRNKASQKSQVPVTPQNDDGVIKQMCSCVCIRVYKSQENI